MGSAAMKASVAVVSITIILSLTLSSFKTFKDSEICLLYDVHTRKVDQKMVTTPGYKHIGLTKRAYCFPKELQTLEFSKGEVICGSIDSTTIGGGCTLSYSSGQTMTRKIETRTFEGLELFLEMSVSYRLDPGQLRTLFETFGPGTAYVRTFQAVGRAAIRNTAATFSATQFLSGDRSDISAQMLLALTPELEAIGATGIENLAFLGQPKLPADFEQAINDVRSASLEVQQAIEQREVTMINKWREGNTTRLQVLATSEAEMTAAIAQKNKASADRVSALISKQADIDKAKLQLETKLLEASSAAAIKLTQAESEATAKLLDARANVNIMLLQKAAEADALLVQMLTEANSTEIYKAAEKSAFLNIKDSLGLDASQVAHWHYLDTLTGLEGATFYIDHDKTFASSGGSVIANINA